MNTIYILIILADYHGTAIQNIEFSSQANCEAAKVAVLGLSKEYHYHKFDAAVCVKK